MTTPELKPLALKDAPALIEAVFPAQKVSFEAQRERKAGAGQTLTALGSYWKGRKPLILVRAIVLGSLLPQTDDTEKDLEIFEKLMGFDDVGLARRAVPQNALKPKDLARLITLENPWQHFAYTIKDKSLTKEEVLQWHFPLDADDEGITLRWQRDVSDDIKAKYYLQALKTYSTYETKSLLCKRPEEVNQEWLYQPVWDSVNLHLGHLGINVHSHQELVEQLGILRYGHKPRVGDTFSGGGSIPFEAARLGCDVYASDLNPIACMLTWGSLNITGATADFQTELEQAQKQVAKLVDDEVTNLKIEHDELGNRAKVYLYCMEIKCPETDWLIPVCPSWIVSAQRNVIARLQPNYSRKGFDIEIISGVSSQEMEVAGTGTLQGGKIVYELEGKKYQIPVKTLRGDYRDEEGNTQNRIRRWGKNDFMPCNDDLFQERLYAIQWIDKDTLKKGRKETFFAAPTCDDLEREKKIEQIVCESIGQWQAVGLVPDMVIEPGDETTRLQRERGWTHWHHLFNPRQLLMFSLYRKYAESIQVKKIKAAIVAAQSKSIEWNSRLCRWATSSRHENQVNTFSNQALNTLYNFAVRATSNLENHTLVEFSGSTFSATGNTNVKSCPASAVSHTADLWITDPPYADAVHYHEITEFFIAWLRKSPPTPFDQWNWDSRRALAIRGSGDDFRRGMVGAYKAMADHMPDNGMQCVMFTHQDTGVWSDMVGIFWAAGLQVVGAWYIATETTSQLKKGGYVQGTVTLMLRKRPAGEKSGFKNRILPAVRLEVQNQIQQMMHLNIEVKEKLGEPVFNDSDLQMAGYAAALKVLTGYTHIGGEDVTQFALRPRQKGEVTVVDEIVQQAAEAANSLLVPEGLEKETWQAIRGIQRFYLRMMDMEEGAGASKLDNYQNFAKAFRVADYTGVMASMTANKARLKGVKDFTSRDLTDSTELGPTHLGRVVIALQQLLAETEPQVVISQLQEDLPDFLESRPLLIDLASFISKKSSDQAVRDVAEVLSGRLRNLRLG
ncbi:anti-phage-associated DUF1156 domain-containing protein [Endozoicomonas sp. ALC020]|uniref:anti-phage-associated DUF1156 domain-containing protein n=1 Tax=unclassified Endozoicomonas TaxID=2644528 RepID=UPI003BB1C26B